MGALSPALQGVIQNSWIFGFFAERSAGRNWPVATGKGLPSEVLHRINLWWQLERSVFLL